MVKLFEEYSNDVEISLIKNEEDKKSSIDIIDETFKKYGGFSTIAGSVNFDISLILKHKDEIVGTYMLGTHPMHLLGNMKHYLRLRGIEGVALAVKPEFRGSGYGNMLKDYSIQNTKADYIWGMQLRDLKNINDWAKRRRIVFSSSSMFITLQDLNDKFPHLHQTSGINCGPTSLKMLLEYYNSKINPSIDELTDIMEVDVAAGTTDVRMRKGLVHCNLNHKQIKVNEGEALTFLKNYVKNDRKILLRTLTRRVKHWVVVYDYKDDLFSVADPWLGKIKYNEEQIYNMET
jgi:GNAT superfamily N-acetyltransferase